MALKTISIGSLKNIHQWDDGSFTEAIVTDSTIKCAAGSDPDDVVRHADIVGILTSAYPIGSIYLSVLSTNPNTLLGFGTWVRIAEGQFLVGFKTGDADFDPVENTGGSKTHTHDVDVANTTSGNPSAVETVDNDLALSTVSVASSTHTHDVDPSSISSGNNSDLPPFYVVYIWKRTA